MRSLRSASLVRIAALSFPILTGVAWGQPLPLEGIACASFRVGDLERSRAYYTGRLGYQQAFELKNAGGTASYNFDQTVANLSQGARLCSARMEAAA